MALTPGKEDLYCIPMKVARQLTATATDAILARVPFRSRIEKVYGAVGAIGGTADPTDVDLMLSTGTTNILTDVMAAVNGSAIASAPVEGSVDKDEAQVEAGATVRLDVTVTGGTSPTVDDVDVWIYLVRE